MNEGRHGYALSGFPRLWRATRVLVSALIWGFRKEEALRLELLGILVFVPLGIYLGSDVVERVLLASTIVLLLIVELLNNAIEAVVDRISLDHHDLSGLAKDLGSAAVGVTLLLALAVWGSILWPF